MQCINTINYASTFQCGRSFNSIFYDETNPMKFVFGIGTEQKKKNAAEKCANTNIIKAGNTTHVSFRSIPDRNFVNKVKETK